MNISREAIDAALETAQEIGVAVDALQLKVILASIFKTGDYRIVDVRLSRSEPGPYEDTAAADAIANAYDTIVLIRDKIETVVQEAETAGEDDEEVRFFRWKSVFERVFDRGERSWTSMVKKALDEIGAEFPSYHDPDTSYEEDARAWIAAFYELADRLALEAGEDERIAARRI